MRFDAGAGTAENDSATFLMMSNFLNLTAVVVVTRRKSPSPTIDALIKAFLSLSRIAGVRVVKEASYIVIKPASPSSFFILTSVGVPYIPNFPAEENIASDMNDGFTLSRAVVPFGNAATSTNDDSYPPVLSLVSIPVVLLDNQGALNERNTGVPSGAINS